jgi:hypothetical protein
VGQNWKSWLDESHCKGSSMGNSGESSKDGNADRNVDVKSGSMRFQMEIRTLLGTGLDVMHVTLW